MKYNIFKEDYKAFLKEAQKDFLSYKLSLCKAQLGCVCNECITKSICKEACYLLINDYEVNKWQV